MPGTGAKKTIGSRSQLMSMYAQQNMSELYSRRALRTAVRSRSARQQGWNTSSTHIIMNYDPNPFPPTVIGAHVQIRCDVRTRTALHQTQSTTAPIAAAQQASARARAASPKGGDGATAGVTSTRPPSPCSASGGEIALVRRGAHVLSAFAPLARHRAAIFHVRAPSLFVPRSFSEHTRPVPEQQSDPLDIFEHSPKQPAPVSISTNKTAQQPLRPRARRL